MHSEYPGSLQDSLGLHSLVVWPNEVLGLSLSPAMALLPAEMWKKDPRAICRFGSPDLDQAPWLAWLKGASSFLVNSFPRLLVL